MKKLRVAVFSRFPKLGISAQLRKAGIIPVKEQRERPDVMICYGGDGTFLLAESRYPGIPKLLVRKNSICKHCHDMPLEDIIPLLARSRFRITKSMKLQATIKRNGKKKGKNHRQITLAPATNEIIIRNKAQVHALRFSVRIGGRIIAQAIGDGIIVATPFGSTAYYHSITRQHFKKGIGIALNNPVDAFPALICDESVVVEVRIERGPGIVSADVEDTMTTVNDGDVIIIKKSPSVARIVAL